MAKRPTENTKVRLECSELPGAVTKCFAQLLVGIRSQYSANSAKLCLPLLVGHSLFTLQVMYGQPIVITLYNHIGVSHPNIWFKL